MAKNFFHCKNRSVANLWDFGSMGIFYRGITPNWPFYLLLVGILVGNFVPLHYRTNFFSTGSGLFLKTKTRKLENIIEMTITCMVIFLVIFLNVF